MQGLSDEERREVLGEVLFDELQTILEYVQRIPTIESKLNEVDERLIRVERIVQMHEVNVRPIRQHLQLA